MVDKSTPLRSSAIILALGFTPLSAPKYFGHVCKLLGVFLHDNGSNTFTNERNGKERGNEYSRKHCVNYTTSTNWY